MHISKLIDKGYSPYTIATFINGGEYSITLPDVYGVYISTNYLKKIFANDVKFDLYKIHTLNGNDLYYFKEQIEIGGYIKKINEKRNSTLFGKDKNGNIVAKYIMSDKAEHLEYCGKSLCSKDGLLTFSASSNKDELIEIDVYIVPYLKKGDVMSCETLFKYNDKKEIEIIAKKQSGVGSDRPNVVEENVGNIDETIQNLDETLFNSLSEKTNSESYIRESLGTYSGLDNYYSSENNGKDFEMFKKR